MVKVVAGKYKGRNLNTPDVNTKPTKGSVKEAIFSSLSFNIQDAMVLDLFAGSGAFGIEALSRGAAFCFFNDLGKIQYKIIKPKNLELLVREGSFLREEIGFWDMTSDLYHKLRDQGYTPQKAREEVGKTYFNSGPKRKG